MTIVEKFTFLGDDIALIFEGEQPWVAIRPVCQALGLPSQEEVRRLSEQPWAMTRWVARRDMPAWWASGEDGRRGVAFLELDALLAWLVTVNPSALSGQASAKLMAYQTRLSSTIRDATPGFTARASALAKLGELLEQARAVLDGLVGPTQEGAVAPAETTVAAPAIPPAEDGPAQHGGQKIVQVIRRPKRPEDTEISAAPVDPPAMSELEKHRAEEKARMIEALTKTKWDRTKAADSLAIPRRTFYRRLKTYGIQ